MRLPGIDLRVRATRHVGHAYPVRQPKWAGDPAQRVIKQGPLSLFTCTTGTSEGWQVLGIALDGEQVLSLNASDATALGLALIAEADRIAQQ